jgi:uncharacterized protein (UPF0333 family)
MIIQVILYLILEIIPHLLSTWGLVELIAKDPSNSNKLSLYTNGTLQTSTNNTLSGSNITNSFYINSRGNTNGNSFNLNIAELIIFNKNLTKQKDKMLRLKYYTNGDHNVYYLVLIIILPHLKFNLFQ